MAIGGTEFADTPASCPLVAHRVVARATPSLQSRVAHTLARRSEGGSGHQENEPMNRRPRPRSTLKPPQAGRPAGLLAALISLSLIAGCGEVRPLDTGDAMVTYVDHIQPLLAARCVSCHGESAPKGSYSLSSYRNLLGPGSDTTRNVVAGDKTSRLLTKLDSQKEATHWAYLLPKQSELSEGEDAQTRRTADLARLTAWIADHKVAYSDGAVHPPSWVYPGERSSEAFHGGALRAAGWSTDGCKTCHGGHLTGGKAGGGSCATCHENGVQSCTTCHGSASTLLGSGSAAPAPDLSWKLAKTARGVGAHAGHLAGSKVFVTIACSDCHTVPSSVSASGHLFDDTSNTKSDLRAEVTFGGTAVQGGFSASYDKSANTCTVYCHSQKGKAATPSWTSTAQIGCDSCHPAPHASPAYGGNDCTVCHQQVAATCPTGSSDCFSVGSGPKMAITAAKHGDGTVSLGLAGAEGTCYGCHGTQTSKGAPAPDLRGSSDTSRVTVGLHAVHRAQSGTYASGVTCSDCHKVPSALKTAGHIDDDLPAEVVFSSLAKGATRGSGVDTKPVWNRTAGTCQNVYCHGLDGGKVTSWSWTQKASPALACDSCHGQPPQKTLSGGTHPQTGTCNTCHSSAYSSSGALDPTKHINGKVDL